MPDEALANEHLLVTVQPEYGGAIGSIRTRASGRELLFQTPWGGAPAGPVPSEEGPAAWLERWRGGWHTLLPNGGTGCTIDGAVHGFHGEGSTAPWAVVERAAAGVSLQLSLFSVPFDARRTIELNGRAVRVTETVTNHGVDPVRFMWVHHPAFGADLIDGDVSIEVAAERVLTDHGLDEPARPWPRVLAPDGTTVDLSRPPDGSSLLAYLVDLNEGHARISRTDATLGATLRWSVSDFPHAWLWVERGGTRGWPWYGRCQVIGIEPTTSWPGRGLVELTERGGDSAELGPGETRHVTVTLEVEDAGRQDDGATR
jgi:galactose mutarotase-like enzyme